MKKKFPQTIYVKREQVEPGSPDDYLTVSEDINKLLDETEADGEAVGVYELKSSKRVTIKKSLDDT